MAEAQSELLLSDPSALADQVEKGSAWLLAFLIANPKGPGPSGAWPGREICSQIGIVWNEKSRRKLRAFREAAGPSIVSGPHGYQHVEHTPISVRRQAAQIRLTQGRKMVTEALRELRALTALESIAMQ